MYVLCMHWGCTKGSFNNCVDQIIPTFDHLTPLEATIVNILHRGWVKKYTEVFTHPLLPTTLMTTYLPLFVHVVIECPRSLSLFGGIHNWRLINHYLTNCIAFFVVFFIQFLYPNALLENAFSHFYSGYCIAFTSWLVKVTKTF